MSVAVIYDRAMSTASHHSRIHTARNGGPGLGGETFTVEDLERVEEAVEEGLGIELSKTHHMIVREFPTWIEPPKTAFDYGHQRRVSAVVENEPGNPRSQSHNSQQNLTNQNIQYQHFLHHLGSLNYEKAGKIPCTFSKMK
jgi:hypothetical protein